VPELWTPVSEGPHEAFVDRVHRAIAKFSETTGVPKPVVEVELADSSRWILDRMEPEPGFGMITIYVQNAKERDLPDALVIPIGLIRRFELRKSPEERVERFGFSVPSAGD
jgi:hypothetical protein